MLNELEFSFGIVGGDVNVASKVIPTEKEKHNQNLIHYGGNQMQQIPKPLAVIDGETLMDKRLPKRSFCIETLLPEGISMLGGAPKIGKSWMVLDIGVRVAKGESIWSLPTKRGTVLYLALEDSLARIQERLCKLTDDVPGNMFFAIAAGTLADDLCFQIEQFISEHRDTVLVIIDTFQIVRVGGIDTSYANDYDEVRELKVLADKMRISLLLVHHLRKQGDSDPLNKLSGTTGISGAMDAVFILDVSKRHARGATLFCTGRDIESRELELNMSRDTCAWELISDTLDKPELTLPDEIVKLAEFVKSIEQFKGGNTEFAELTEKATKIITAESEKQAGKVSESLASLVAKWEKRQSILWWVQILFAVVPSVLALLSVVFLDWLR